MADFSGILKRERYYGKRFTSMKELVVMIQNDTRYYNAQRVHTEQKKRFPEVKIAGSPE